MSGKLVGRLLLEQYRVDTFIDSGGMGAVYRVWDLKRNVPLAMKVLHSDLADDPHVFKRFQREANALKRLSHPNIVQFYGLFQTMDLAFLLERYVDGPSLKDILRNQAGKPLPHQDVLIYIKALSSALGYAHANGVVHCDVKPGNVLVDQGGNIYLTDFGIARHAESTTTTMATAGTAAYMAPEQILGETVTPATDVYALGIILFEMLTGQRPFRGNESGTEKGGQTANERIRYAQLHLPTPHPRSINPALSYEVERVVLKALEKNPTRRYASTQQFFEALYTCLGTAISQIPDRIHLPDRFREGTEIPMPMPPPAPTPGQAVGSAPTSQPKKVFPWLVGGSTILLLIGGTIICLLIGFIVLSRKTSNPPPAFTEPASSSPENTIISFTESPSQTVAPTVVDTEPIPTTVATEIPATIPTEIPITEPTVVKNSVARIAYVVGQSEKSGSIYIADPNGANRQQIIGNSCVNAEPDWSPDGMVLIYQSNCFGTYDILSIHLNGSGNESLIADPSMDEREAHFSNGGTKIAYVRRGAGGLHNTNGDIRIFELGGRDISTGFEGRSPVFSPDDSQLALMALTGKYWQILVCDLAAHTCRQITKGNHDSRWPTWSPDGRYIAYSSATGGGSNPTGIWKIAVSGGDPEPVITNGDYGRPSWSEKDLLVFNSGSGLWKVYPDGSGLSQVSNDQGWAAAWSR